MPDDIRALREGERVALERLHPDVFTRSPREIAEAGFIAGLRYGDGECEALVEALGQCGAMANALEDDAFVAARKGEMLNARRVQYKADRIAREALSALSASRKVNDA